MVNLAVVIAVTDYTHDAKSLAACRTDGNTIAELPRKTEKFDDVLEIVSNTPSTQVKQKLAGFVSKYKEAKVSEVIFYFSGHGAFEDDEFYCLLSDYQSRRLKQTALSNLELDGMVRALSPDLFVKIVDACHSGVTYVKSPDDLREYMKASNARFKRVYFMFSSQSDQFSYASSEVSHFTESVLGSIANHIGDQIRYKDITDYVSDDFRNLNRQTPLFVTQADFTEPFCSLNPTIRSLLAKFSLNDLVGDKPEITQEKATNIIDKIKKDAERYSTKEEVLEVLNGLGSMLKEAFPNLEIFDVYNLIVTTEEIHPPAASMIGRWLASEKSDHEYFARPLTERREFTKQVPKNTSNFGIAGIAAFYSNNIKEIEYEEVTEFRDVMISYELTMQMPYVHIKMRLEPKYPNLTPVEAFVSPVVSKTNLRLFWSSTHYAYVDWERTRRVGKIEWFSDEVLSKDTKAVREITTRIAKEFSDFVEGALNSKWGNDPAS